MRRAVAERMPPFAARRHRHITGRVRRESVKCQRCSDAAATMGHIRPDTYATPYDAALFTAIS